MNGLVRFDGLNFSIFNKGNSPGILSNRFIVLGQSTDGDLWAVYERNGILRYHKGRFRTYDVKDGVPGNDVSTVTTDSMGNVWILSNGKVAQWQPQLDRFRLSTELNKRVYGPLVWENKGFVAYDSTNLYCFSRGRSQIYRLPERLTGKRILRVGLAQDWVAWLTMSDGAVIRLAPRDTTDGRELPKKRYETYLSPNGGSWIFHISSEFMRSFSAVSDGRTLDISFRDAYPDRQGNLWLATEEGLFRIREQVIRSYSVQQGLLDRDVYPVYQDHAGSLWLGAWHKGLSRFANGRFDSFTVADGLPGSLVSSIYQGHDGRLWIATHGGVTTYVDGHFSTAGVPPFPDGVVQAMLQDRAGTMWFGTRSGVLRLEHGVLRPLAIAGENSPRDIHVIAESDDGDLWFGGVNGLSQLRGGQVKHWSVSDGLGSNDVWSLLAESDGTLWIGTFGGGLARLKDGQIARFTTADGLFDDGVFQILDDGLGSLWISCSRGIYRVGKTELTDFAEHKRPSIASFPYGKADGLLTLAFNGGVSPAGTKTADGMLWFPSRDGVAVIDPTKVRVDSHIPAVAIETASLDQVPISLDTPVVIPPTKYNLQIEYTAPEFVRPDQLRFRYKLRGLDHDWIDVGSHRSASFTHLPPGHYQFIVSAENSNGIWSPPSEPVSIKVLAPFYKTQWFELLLLTTISLIVLAVLRYRLVQLKAKHATRLNFLRQLITSQEDERKRIARELHDSLGQRLVVINSTAKLALRSRGIAARSVDTVFEEISSEATAGLEDTRSIAYDLRPSHLDRLGLTQSIEYLVQKASIASNTVMTAKLDNIDDLIPADQSINLYRIVQEAIGNVMKYSSASESHVRIERGREKAVLTIQDDGIGFEVEGSVNKTGRIGLGLRGMAERASLLGSEVKIISAPGRGTLIIVEIKVYPNAPNGS